MWGFACCFHALVAAVSGVLYSLRGFIRRVSCFIIFLHLMFLIAASQLLLRRQRKKVNMTPSPPLSISRCNFNDLNHHFFALSLKLCSIFACTRPLSHHALARAVFHSDGFAADVSTNARKNSSKSPWSYTPPFSFAATLFQSKPAF